MDKIEDAHIRLIINEDLFPVSNTDVVVEEKKEEVKPEVKPEPTQLAEPKPEPIAPTPSIKVQPKKLDDRLLIVTPVLSDASNATLQKLVKAIKLNPDQILIVNEWPTSYDHIRVLAFGFSAQHNYPLHQVQKQDKSEILATHEIPHLDANPNEKVALWNQLKSWFKIG